jgi:D-alanine transaminase
MSKFAYYNGVFDLYENIRIPLSDRAIFFGDGVYDAALGAGNKIYLIDRHIERFLGNLKRLSIRLEFTAEKLKELIYSVVRRCGFNCFFLYFQASRRCTDRIHSNLSSDGANLLITVKECPIPTGDLMHLYITEDLRYYYCDIKTLNLLPQTLYASLAESNGCDECVLHRFNTVTECSHSNISIIKNGVLYTHPNSRLILPGITRASILSFCEANGIPFKEIPFSLKELQEADDIIVSSTTKLACPAVIGDGDGKSTALCEKICNGIKKQSVEFAL